MTLKHQYNSVNASHRIVSLDIAGFLKDSGHWASYQNIAVYNTNTGVIYIAVTEYFAGSSIQSDKIYQLWETKFESEKAIMNELNTP